MTSTIKVNNIQNQCGANIINENSNTITIGASGDTINLASGASQSGFGRTGTVDWQTGSIKTATFTASNGEGYFCNTSAGAFTVNLPSSPSPGNIVAVKDYAQTFSTHNITLGRGGSPIEGVSLDVTLDGDAESVTFVYVDATKGWVLVNEATTKYGPDYITASGGTISTIGDFKYHKFTGPGTFTVCSVGNPAGSDTVTTFVVAGGGGGKSNGGGGGGAGGLRNIPGVPVTAQGYSIAVGGGGTGGPPGCNSTAGVDSTAITTTSAGGGRGGSESGGTGGNGGSGGGGGGNGGSAATGGTGNTPPVSPPQGNPGGSHGPVPNYNSGAGGGGHGGAGSGGPSPGSPGNPGGTGGNGTDVSPTFPAPLGGSPAGNYAGGGGGAGNDDGPGTASNTPSAPGGGGFGKGGGSGTAGSGTSNTGGGGGGAPTAGGTSGGGGSGIVIIKYKFQN
mgnify:FL=1|tara:strand:+ start:1314 stop:2660 length:1347 start_codon:yes stop_codon:yes gene_type:complete